MWRPNPELIIALIGRGMEYAAYVAIIIGCWQIYHPAGWIIGGVLVLQATLRSP